MQKNSRRLVAASVLSADFANIARDVRMAEQAGADWLHMDVMDGHFVPNLTFGPKMVADVRAVTRLPLDVHLMVERPEALLSEYLSAGADHVTFHVEAAVHVHRILTTIKNAGKRAGVSLVPSTPADTLTEILGLLDLVLVMTVNPGFGGQSLIEQCLTKIRKLAQLRQEGGHSFLIAVDGGINSNTVERVRNSGADVLISGSAFFSSDDPAGQVNTFKGRAVV